MILVAVIAVSCECGRLIVLSSQYRQKANVLRLYGRWPGPASDDGRARYRRQIAWAQGLVGRYEYAARYPWLPVEPDPPEPE